MPQFLSSEPAEAMLAALSDALDLVDFGIVLLDRDTRVRFVNRYFVELSVVGQELLATGPNYREMLSHVAESGQYAVPPNELSAYIAEREAAVRAGSIEPMEIDLRDGRRLLFRSIVTPDGGRILTYTDVTHTKAEVDEQRLVRDAVERASVELRFSNETLENQASYLVSLAEDSDANARRAEDANRQLEHEIAERRLLEAELLRLATTDALTGALNRRQLFKLGQQELLRVRELGEGLAVLMVDIDHFKYINDQHGHPVGDEALKHVVGRLRAGVRRVDLIGRVGGEEFAIVLSAITAEVALKVAERVRAAVAAKALLHDTVRVRMTISVGLAMARDTDDSIEQVIARADKQLYQAKRSGRDRVCHAELAVPAC
jgi:diguanylate cyclase (GGDEF)-like protein